MGNCAAQLNASFEAWSTAHASLVELEHRLARYPLEACPDELAALEHQVGTLRHRAQELLRIAHEAMERRSEPPNEGSDHSPRRPP